MQEAFDFASGEVSGWLARLIGWVGDPLPVRRRTPLGQLVKSIISARTLDAVSTAAYDRLAARYPSLGAVGDETPAAIEPIIADVTFAADKAGYLVAAVRAIGEERRDHDLAFLAGPPLAAALAWLERLPGVARKVSASTLNASTLGRPVFIVDTHVLRVLQRLGFVSRRADYRAASEAATASGPRWRGDDFLRLHILMKRLGQTVCRWDVADCGRCPLATQCATARRSPDLNSCRTSIPDRPAIRRLHPAR